MSNLTTNEIETLKKNIYDTQRELQNAYKRIAELTDEVIALQREQNVNLGRS